ncbi:hypothetical protein [Synechococcus sp. PCC 7336]|uniref:hypothetical protein n=1 Tax=Synechococcus sp. PCC 7336 TaxID=195250 RepID=UPI00036BF966|nr:hypothetical protein [Synechococcus sp. PCC 7336]
MKHDLHSLYFKKNEITQYICDSDREVMSKMKPKLAWIVLNPSKLPSAIGWGLAWIGLTAVIAAIFPQWLGFITFTRWVAICWIVVSHFSLEGLISYVESKRKFRETYRLLKEVKEFNITIKNIDTRDRLAECGHLIDLSERDRAIEALQIARNILVRALNTERILRENPYFCPKRFDIDLTSLNAIQVNEKASHYAQSLSAALSISASVQTEMKKLLRQ